MKTYPKITLNVIILGTKMTCLLEFNDMKIEIFYNNI